MQASKLILMMSLSLSVATTAFPQEAPRTGGAWVGTADLLQLQQTLNRPPAALGERSFGEQVRAIDRLNLSPAERNARVSQLMRDMAEVYQSRPSGPKPPLSLDVGAPEGSRGAAVVFRWTIQLGQ